MKLLLDTCISWTVRDALQAAGHDVIWTGDWLKDPGDEEILEYGCRENRILITLDKDFGELAVVRGQSHAGIIRLVNWSSSQQAAYLSNADRAIWRRTGVWCHCHGGARSSSY